MKTWLGALLIGLPLLYFGGAFLARSRENQRLGTPDAVKHGEFMDRAAFRLPNFVEIDVRSAGKITFDMKSWDRPGNHAPCEKNKITNSAGLFRVDNCGANPDEVEINDRPIKVPTVPVRHHVLIDESGVIKIVAGETIR